MILSRICRSSRSGVRTTEESRLAIIIGIALWDLAANRDSARLAQKVRNSRAGRLGSWLGRKDSNLQPSDPEQHAISTTASRAGPPRLLSGLRGGDASEPRTQIWRKTCVNRLYLSNPFRSDRQLPRPTTTTTARSTSRSLPNASSPCESPSLLGSKLPISSTTTLVHRRSVSTSGLNDPGLTLVEVGAM